MYQINILDYRPTKNDKNVIDSSKEVGAIIGDQSSLTEGKFIMKKIGTILEGI